jgi:outer membrane protein OmpA-like peptidoglycan-associated protein
MKPMALAAAVLLAGCVAPRPCDEALALQASNEVAEARIAALQAQLEQSEEQRARASARARELEQARELNASLSAEVRRLEAQVAELKAHETKQGWIFTLGNDVLFDVGRATLKPSGRRAIAQLARLMREHPDRKIVVEGFTDDRGSPQYNRQLSERRARAVREALVHEGIDPERVVARGLGEAYPVATNGNPRGRELNRRVEILIGEAAGRAATGASSR